MRICASWPGRPRWLGELEKLKRLTFLGDAAEIGEAGDLRKSAAIGQNRAEWRAESGMAVIFMGALWHKFCACGSSAELG